MKTICCFVENQLQVIISGWLRNNPGEAERWGLQRIQGWDPLRGGSRDEEAGQAPHGHGHRGSLSEVWQGQQDPISHHRRLTCGMECLENLEMGASEENNAEETTDLKQNGQQIMTNLHLQVKLKWGLSRATGWFGGQVSVCVGKVVTW